MVSPARARKRRHIVAAIALFLATMFAVVVGGMTASIRNDAPPSSSAVVLP